MVAPLIRRVRQDASAVTERRRLVNTHRILVQLMKRGRRITPLAGDVLKGSLLAWRLHGLPESDEVTDF